MPIYYFHLRDGEDVVLDPDGRELNDEAAIASAALAEARAIIADDARSGTIMLDQRIDVEDPEGHVVHQLYFGAAVQIIYRR
jgi:hypothetical protein